jgi:hypothetical protein
MADPAWTEGHAGQPCENYCSLLEYSLHCAVADTTVYSDYDYHHSYAYWESEQEST